MQKLKLPEVSEQNYRGLYVTHLVAKNKKYCKNTLIFTEKMVLKETLFKNVELVIFIEKIYIFYRKKSFNEKLQVFSAK